jgi:hypothetical protein
MTLLIRLTLFKIPSEEGIKQAVKVYSTLVQDAKKVSIELLVRRTIPPSGFFPSFNTGTYASLHDNCAFESTAKPVPALGALAAAFCLSYQCSHRQWHR